MIREPGGTGEIRVRPFHDGDYPSLVALRNEIMPGRGETVETQRNSDALLRRHDLELVRLIAERGAEVVGLCDVFGSSQTWTVNVGVTPRMRRRGIGSLLWARVEDMLVDRQASIVRTPWMVAENQGDSDFLRFHGFRERERAWDQTLDLATFDPSRYPDPAAVLARRGMTVTSLAAEGADNARVRQQVYTLHIACRRDQPPLEDHASPIPFDFWLARMIHDHDALLDAFFLAKIDDEYVGMSLLQRTREPDVVENGFTGGLPAYRNRGIARALKLQAIAYARAHGYREISTGNHAANGPMLHVNESLGFRKVAERVRFEKQVCSSTRRT